MHTFRVFLIVSIAIGLHGSVCTGGVFAFGADVAAALSSPEDAPMTHGFVGILSCEQPGENEESDVRVDIGGCEGGSTCLTQSQSIMEERSLFVYVGASDTLLHPTGAGLASDSPASDVHFSRVRAGPLYEHSYLVAHILVKRE